MRRLCLSLVGYAAVVAVACGGSKPPAQTPEPPAASAPTASAARSEEAPAAKNDNGGDKSDKDSSSGESGMSVDQGVAAVPGRQVAGAEAAHVQPDLARVTLPGWSATAGQTQFERFVDYREPAGTCTVRVTHWFPARPGEPSVEPSPVAVLGRRDVGIDGRRFILLRTSETGHPQSVSIDRGGRTALLRFSGCNDTTIDQVLARTHLAGPP